MAKSKVQVKQNRLLSNVKRLVAFRSKLQPSTGKKGKGMRVSEFPRNISGKSGFGNKKSITISENEYIQEINSNNSSTAFFMSAILPVNPGQVSTFPWLSTIAANYQKYQFTQLEFMFKPEVTQFAPTGANTGKVIMSAEYNSSLGAPNNKEDMEDTLPNANDMPYENINLKLDPLECHKNSDAKFIRSAGLPGGSDIKTYDCANLYIATQNQTCATTGLGELHVRYTVILSDPVILGQLGVPVNNSVTNLVDSKQPITSTVSYQPLLAAAATTALPVANGCGVVNTIGSIVPPLGNYLLSISSTIESTSQTINGFAVSVLKNNIIQNQITDNSLLGTPVTYAFGNGSTSYQNHITLGGTMFLSCNGTDAITLSLWAMFASGTVTATTVLCLVAI
jgi:hypothetical protein